MKLKGGLSKEQYEAVIAKVETLYAPLLKEVGKELDMNSMWEDETVNASAQEDLFGKATINIYGGLARHAATTPDGFTLVLCHEMGHHLGGAPKFSIWNTWGTVESQADYFATLKCLRRVFLNDDNAAAIKGKTVPTELKEACEKSFSGDDRNICIRSGLAAMAVRNVVAFITGESDTGTFATPDKTIVTETNESYPSVQCRLDTFYQGAICSRPYHEDVSDKDPVKGTCDKSLGDKVGMRPLCWYHPEKN
jgi:hypothetical protein